MPLIKKQGGSQSTTMRENPGKLVRFCKTMDNLMNTNNSHHRFNVVPKGNEPEMELTLKIEREVAFSYRNE